MRLIANYILWMGKGKFEKSDWHGGGLCNVMPFKYRKDFSMFIPTTKELNQLGGERMDMTFWASGLKDKADYDEAAYAFTPLRQTIVLFICAMNNEL